MTRFIRLQETGTDVIHPSLRPARSPGLITERSMSVSVRLGTHLLSDLLFEKHGLLGEGGLNESVLPIQLL